MPFFPTTAPFFPKVGRRVPIKGHDSAHNVFLLNRGNYVEWLFYDGLSMV